MEKLEYIKELNEESIKLVENNYNLKIIGVWQQFIGADTNTFVYKIKSKNKEYFLKIRTGIFNGSSAIIPYLLSQYNVKHIIEPIKTINEELFCKTEKYTVILYPFINGKSGFNTDLTKEQWIEFGKTLHQIHNFEISNKLHNILFENYDNKWRKKLKKYIDMLNKVKIKNVFEKEFVEIIQSKKDIINKMIFRIEDIIQQMEKMEKTNCLCHGDIHAGNILLTDNNFYIVDWDTLIIAPKERDLMFIGAGIGNKWKKN